MITCEEIRNGIKELVKRGQKIHVDFIKRRHPLVTDMEAVIREVYPNLFRIESQGVFYTVQYVDLLTKEVRIKELADICNLDVPDEDKKTKHGYRMN